VDERQKSAQDVPTAALVLGIAGLIPFATGAVMAFLDQPWNGVTGGEVVRTYGAIILAFMGGTQWGAALRDTASLWARYGYAVLPALIAWPVLLLPAVDGLVWLVAGFVFVYVLDEWMRFRGWLPGWYMRLRRLLTAAVLAALAVTLAGTGG
jgi:hypothetical protein